MESDINHRKVNKNISLPLLSLHKGCSYLFNQNIIHSVSLFVLWGTGSSSTPINRQLQMLLTDCYFSQCSGN